MGRSILGLFSGFVATIVLALGCDALVRAAAPGAFGPDGRSPGPVMLGVGVLYTLLAATAGGYLAAFIARRAEVMHALFLGTLGALATLIVIVASPAGQRTAAQFVSAMLVIPATMLGGWMRARSREAS
jgi:hypothetical protein